MNCFPELHEIVWIVLQDEDVVHRADLVYLLAPLRTEHSARRVAPRGVQVHQLGSAGVARTPPEREDAWAFHQLDGSKGR